MYLLPRRNPTGTYRTCLLATLIFLLLAQCSCDEDSSTLDNPKQQPLTPTSGKSAARNDNNNSQANEDEPKSDLKSENNDTSSVTNVSTSFTNEANGLLHHFGLDTGVVKRTFYVVAALTGVVVIYFTFKGVRMMRRRRRKPRRYGLLAENQEMKQFRDEEEDDSDMGDEDATLFDARKHKSTNKRGP